MIISNLISDYNKGIKISNIKEKYNISKAKIYKILTINNIPKERQFIIKEILKTEIFVDDFITKNGFPPTYRIVANEFNIQVNSAYNRLKNYRNKMNKTK